MGQLLFCSHALAKKPYDIESASLNIYSLEEMSYYLIHNAEFVEMDFVGRTFCDWVRTEIKEEGLACKLEEALEQGVPSYEFARILLEETGYATEAEQQAAMEIFRQLEEKDELSRHKLRADRLLRREKISLRHGGISLDLTESDRRDTGGVLRRCEPQFRNRLCKSVSVFPGGRLLQNSL